MNTGKIARMAAEAGRIILENGGETYRVEDTILRICQAYHLMDADSFVTPTVVMVSVTDNSGQTVSTIKRIRKRTVNLSKVLKVNDLSRNIKTYNYTAEFINEELDRIDALERYSPGTTIFFSALAAAAFTLLFRGNFNDFLASFLIGAVIKLMSIVLNNVDVNEFFINILGGALTAFLAVISVNLHIAHHMDKVIIGSIMLLVPGLAITNAIRDTIAGDLVAGITRAIEAFLVAVAIAIGSGITLKIWMIVYGGL